MGSPLAECLSFDGWLLWSSVLFILGVPEPNLVLKGVRNNSSRPWSDCLGIDVCQPLIEYYEAGSHRFWWVNWPRVRGYASMILTSCQVLGLSATSEREIADIPNRRDFNRGRYFRLSGSVVRSFSNTSCSPPLPNTTS